MPSLHDELTVYTVSDASGETAELVAKAAALQFKGHSIKLVRLPRARSPEQIAGMVTLAAQTDCIIAFTIVDQMLRETLQNEGKRRSIPTVDILGSLIKVLSLVLGAEPRFESGLLHFKDEQYFTRMDAIEFAIQYDDAKDPKGLLLADLVLIGVSRTSKTPTCMYLAQHRGVKASNVPLVLHVPPPAELFSLPAGRVIGLTLHPGTLHEIRHARLQSLGLGENASYANLERIELEVAYAQEVFRRLRCPVVDVTHKAIEETVAEILELTQRKETYV
ncbi:MAG: kinase/pyrophosphorylase [Cyanobacteria bacterium REEB65]|nr:kinase/pyrophosphorylase [Cyanobacteria bacterium REEB65]